MYLIEHNKNWSNRAKHFCKIIKNVSTVRMKIIIPNYGMCLKYGVAE